MRQKVAKKLRRKALNRAGYRGYAALYQALKKGWNRTPRNKRNVACL